MIILLYSSGNPSEDFISPVVSELHYQVHITLVVVVLFWVKAEPLYPHHNFIANRSCNTTITGLCCIR